MKYKNLLAVLFILWFSSSICFSQYRGVERKPTNYINNMTKIQNEFLKKLNKATSLDTFFIPTDYAQIQDAIDIADSGDVVIIEEGTYYQHFSFEGKAIKVGSEYLIDDDTSHITKTIIDGSMLINPDSASLVYFNNGEDSNSVLCGLTLQNGRGTYGKNEDNGFEWKAGGAIFMWESGGIIKNNIIKNCKCISTTDLNGGGGIDCYIVPDSLALIIRENKIVNNSVSGGDLAMGAGIEIALVEGKIIIEKNIIQGNTGSATGTGSGHGGNGGGIAIEDSKSDSIFIMNNFINNNQITEGYYNDGGGIMVINSNATIFNNIITENNCLGHRGRGGAITVGTWNADDPSIYNVEIVNNTIVRNLAKHIAGGIYINNLNVKLMNNIIRENTDPLNNQILFNESKYSSTVTFSNIENGFVGEGNIDVDPSFIDSVYCILPESNSPCIDEGNPDPMHNDREVDPFYPARGTLRNDMGAFGGPYSKWAEMSIIPADPATSIRGNFEFIPEEFSLSQNYPNPFNPSTTIKYSIPTSSVILSAGKNLKDFSSQASQNDNVNVGLRVYDILGREVAVLINEKQKPGNYEVEWNANDKPSGVYFYKLRAGKFTDTKKFILMK